jgi:hypothetical protein
LSAEATIAGAAARVAALRARCSGGSAALRLDVAEALLRHAEQREGRARQLLARRLDEMLIELAKPATCVRDAGAATLPERRTLAGAAMLREFVAHLSAGDDYPAPAKAEIGASLPLTAFAASESSLKMEAGIASGLPMEPKSLRHFRRAWSRLAEEQRLQETMADLPENAGPLNAHLLMHRALQRMNDVSPDYLGGFLHYAETLLWLETSRSSVGLVRR